MIEEVTLDNISILDNSFLSVEKMVSELSMNPFSKILVYVQDGKVVGYLYYSDIYERAEINQLEVEVSYRNCGIGSRLMKYFIKSVDKSITLEVKKDNIPALRLYRKFDFQSKAIRKGYYQGIDGILMERKNNNQ